MTDDNPLCTPWTVHFDRDGTEDVAIIRDADGHDLVASRHFWLPVSDGPTPPTLAAVWAMQAAPDLLALLKVAVATADPARHKWVDEAWRTIEAACGEPFFPKEAVAVRHLHRAAPRLFAALEAALATIEDYRRLAEAVCLIHRPQGDDLPQRIEKVRHEAFSALAEARGEIAF